MSGQVLYDILRDEFHLQMEMAAASYVLSIMTIADKEEGWQRLAEALLQIDGRLQKTEDTDITRQNEKTGTEKLRPEAKLTISEAFERVYGGRIYNKDSIQENLPGRASEGVRRVPLSQAAGHISGDFVCLYPPGIPLLVPGEVIETHLAARIEESLRLGLSVQGVSADGTLIIC